VQSILQEDISLALNTFETFRQRRWDRLDAIGEAEDRENRSYILIVEEIRVRVFFRSENSKRSKEIKLCIVCARARTHTHTHTHKINHSHSCRLIRASFAFAKSFTLGLRTRSRSVARAIARASSCCCNVL